MSLQLNLIIVNGFSDLKSLNKFISFFLILLLSSCGNDSKICYVDINKLYESFEYKKELTLEYNKIKTTRQRICDSLDYELNTIANDIEKRELLNAESENEFSIKRKKLYQLSKQFEEDNKILLETYDAKIIKQLNSYIKEFGKKNSYQLLLGADMKGSILYGDAKIDETDKLINYVNERYKGASLN